MQHGFAPGEWQTQVAWRRYVDDLLMTSTWYCRSCLIDAIACFTRVPFEAAQDDEAGRTAQWIDLRVSLMERHMNIEWAPRQLGTKPAWDCTMQHLRSYVLGPIARWQEAQLSLVQCQFHSVSLIDALLQCQWSVDCLRRLFHSMPRSVPHVQRECFIIALRTCVRRQASK